jgi:large subunit ribosomal protein L19
MSSHLIHQYEYNQIQNSKLSNLLNKNLSGSVMQVKLKSIQGTKAQTFTGLCISHRKKGLSSSILLRNFIAGEAVEYLVYPYSSHVDDIQVLQYNKLNIKYRRAKLYYLRNRTPKESSVVLK